MDAIATYLEVGAKRVFAGAVDWPGWCRAGRDDAAALQALFDYGPRYATVVKSARLSFQAPDDPAALKVRERLKGNATTDFGAPDIAPAADRKPFDEAEARRLLAVLRACWRAFDKAAEAAQGRDLRKGPRGGGRDVDAIAAHVLGAEESYLRQIGWKLKSDEAEDYEARAARLRREVERALQAGARGELPERGPRGGKLWTPRYFARRAAWHVLDHAWEIEDRVE
jgi:hypothetical protein